MIEHPAEWDVVELGSCLHRIEAGSSPDLPDRPAGPDEWGVLKVSAVRSSGFEAAENKVVTNSAAIDRSVEVRNGDLLMTRANTPQLVGQACYVENSPERLLLCDKTLRLVVDERKLTGRFAAHMLATPSVRRQIEASGTGSSGSMKNISQVDVRALRFALPSVREQNKIVEILRTVDESIRLRELCVSKLKRVRLAIVEDSFRCVARAGWRWSTVGVEFEVKSGITLGSHRAPRSRPAPYLRVANVHRGQVNLHDVAQLEELNGDRPKFQVSVDDLLIVEGHANPHEIGRCALVGEPAAGLLFQNHLFRLRSNTLVPVLSEAWLNSSTVREYWRRVCSSSSGLYTINSTKLAAVPVFVPPMEDQEGIASRIREVDAALAAERDRVVKMRMVKKGMIDDLLAGRAEAEMAI